MTKRQLSIISAALNVSVVLYVAGIFMMARVSYLYSDWTMRWSLQEFNLPLTYMMAGQAVLAAVLSLVLPKIFPRSLLKGVSGPERVVALLQLLLAEAVVIFGFMVSFLNRSPLWILPFAAVGLILQFLTGPFFGFPKTEA